MNTDLIAWLNDEIADAEVCMSSNGGCPMCQRNMPIFRALLECVGERAAVVAWLEVGANEDCIDIRGNLDAVQCTRLAEAISRGEHIRKAGRLP